MTQYVVLIYYYHSKTAHVIILYTSIIKKNSDNITFQQFCYGRCAK